jgi:hypothetical protein
MPTPRVDFKARDSRPCEAPDCSQLLSRTARAHAKTCSPRCRKALWQHERATALEARNRGRQEPVQQQEHFPGTGEEVPADLLARPEGSYGLDLNETAWEPQDALSSPRPRREVFHRRREVFPRMTGG